MPDETVVSFNNHAFPDFAYRAMMNYGSILAELDKKEQIKNTYHRHKTRMDWTPTRVKELHNHCACLYQSHDECRDIGTFKQLCDAPFETMFGAEVFPTVYLKAAKILEGFATHQVFIDGNKRIACAAMIDWLECNRIVPTFNETDIYQLVIDVANSKFHKNQTKEVDGIFVDVTYIEIAEQIEKNSEKLSRYDFYRYKNKAHNYEPYRTFGSAKTFDRQEYDIAMTEEDNSFIIEIQSRCEDKSM